MVEIRDKGDGLSEEQMKLLTDPGYSGGSGLGLYIVRWLSLLMDIGVSVEGNGRSGTTVRLHIPFKPGRPEDAATSNTSLAVPAIVSGKTILIADNVLANRYVLAKNLTAAGCTVIEAKNGRELLEQATRQVHEQDACNGWP